jgi:hypothetical protein
LLCDGDGQFDPADAVLLASKAGDYDVVLGCRVRRADSLVRRLNSRAWSILMRLRFGLCTTDLDCGFKLFHRKVHSNLALEAEGAMISAELMAKLAGRGARITEVGCSNSAVQSGNNLRVIGRAFKELFALYWKLRTAPRKV